MNSSRPCLSSRTVPGAAAVIVALMLAVRPLAAHGLALQPHELAGAWTLDPWLLASLVLPAWLYARGTRRLWTSSGYGRGIRPWQMWCGAAGLLVLILALVSPLDQMGGALFSAHMTQHQLLMVAAAPLVILAAPTTAMVWAFPPPQRRALGAFGNRITRSRPWRALMHPAMAWALHAAAIWVWHAPFLYQQTLDNGWIHFAQHVSFFGSALLFWWTIVHPRGGAVRGRGIALLSVFSTAVHGSILGALLVFASTPLYPVYAGRVEPWGLTLLEDQQLGGLIMWVPAGIGYTAAALVLFAAWLQSMERRHARATPA